MSPNILLGLKGMNLNKNYKSNLFHSGLKMSRNIDDISSIFQVSSHHIPTRFLQMKIVSWKNRKKSFKIADISNTNPIQKYRLVK